ncbi:hypothetical protein M9445_00800 [Proteus mirabilis]|uniref:hypothetical protein n=1 Tax=Proteus mirabilis TaxID=584 RepID=UPI0018A5DA89|nr:hypothetical protein [Proteus mirabilis]QOR44358.1 hypothetical protein GV833_17970 [Proteus mirabilis]
MKLKNILDAMQCGANWLFGMYQRPYLEEWDDYLNHLIDECSIVDERDCVITFNDGGEKVEVWKENKYYAYGNQNNVSSGEAYEFRPSFRTMIKLSNLVDNREQNRVNIFANELRQKVKK